MTRLALAKLSARARDSRISPRDDIHSSLSSVILMCIRNTSRTQGILMSHTPACLSVTVNNRHSFHSLQNTFRLKRNEMEFFFRYRFINSSIKQRPVTHNSVLKISPPHQNKSKQRLKQLSSFTAFRSVTVESVLQSPVRSPCKLTTQVRRKIFCCRHCYNNCLFVPFVFSKLSLLTLRTLFS